LTAIPSLNLQGLDELTFSKAHQLVQEQEQNDEIERSLNVLEETIIPKETPKILNPGVSMTKPLVVKRQIIKVVKRKTQTTATTTPPSPLPETKSLETKKTSPISINQKQTVKLPTVNNEPSPPAKRLKLEHSPAQEMVHEDNDEEPTIESKPEEVKPTNKLLALFEVTPEQYEKFTQSFSSADRNAVTNFLNMMETEEPTADKGKVQFLINSNIFFYSLFVIIISFKWIHHQKLS
jgi:hypothetical protein